MKSKVEKMKNRAIPRRILFVCTGNIFRSLVAKYSLEDYLRKRNIKDVVIDSAGTVARKECINPAVLSGLKQFGIDPSGHRQKKLTKKDLNDHDIVIVMAQNHIDFIRSKFGFNEAVLFNEVAEREKKSVPDVDQAVPRWKSNKKRADQYFRKTTRYIHNEIPKLYKGLDSYLFFLDLINGRKPQKFGFPFMPLYESKNTISFMSISIPQKEDGHILVIPKRRYQNLDNVPRDTLKELILAVSTIGRAVRSSHGGYNVILNNGSDAGQYIFHTHFHVIPRNKNDSINIEIWKSKRLNANEFMSMNNRIRNSLDNPPKRQQ